MWYDITEQNYFTHKNDTITQYDGLAMGASSSGPLQGHWIGSPKSVTGRGWMKHHPARAKIITVLLETLMVILQSLNHRWRSLRYDSR